MVQSKRKNHHRKPSRLPQIVGIGGLVLVVIAILVFKERPQATVPITTTNASAAAQLDQALAEKRPTLAFFHSNNCQQCIVMIDVVAQVYPEFSSTVTLVDIDVYDAHNTELLNRVGLQYIPTLIFYDQNGKEQVSVGVLQAEQLRQTLAELAGDG